MLCIALTLVFAAASLSANINAIQHISGDTGYHQHTMLSSASAVHDHVDDHHDASPDEESRSDNVHGNHHHHGDSGSSALAHLQDADTDVVAITEPQLLAQDNQVPGSHILGLERPPKQLTLNA